MYSTTLEFVIFTILATILFKPVDLRKLQYTVQDTAPKTDVPSPKITISCKQGYHGPNCETYAFCTSAPCQNGGTCIEGTLGYNCTCPPGYTGKNCEITVSDCSSAPCRNGGTCVDGQNSYICTCTGLYTGTNCETAIPLYNTCESQPCQNGGTCIDSVTGYTCNCTDDYTGVYCENDYCVFYVTETSISSSTIGGYITKVDESGEVTRLTNSGSYTEQGIAVHGDLIFYTTLTSKQVWRVTVDNPGSTRVSIWTAAQAISGLGITRSFERLFVDLGVIYTVQMIDYEGTPVGTLVLPNTTSSYRQFATDEARRILYFADEISNNIYYVTFNADGFTGSAAIIIAASAVGTDPTGLAYVPEENRLYWIRRDTREIRWSLVSSPTISEIIVPGDATSGSTYGLAVCAGYFYYTSYSATRGVWKTSPGNNTRVRVTTGPILRTWSITRP